MPTRSLSRDEVRDIDRRAIEEYGLPGVVLMENAGRGVAELLVSVAEFTRIRAVEANARIPKNSATIPRIVICAGKGNNGGDGFVIARHLEIFGHPVRVLLVCEPDGLQGDAAINYKVIAAAETPIRVIGNQPDAEELARDLADADWIVDALLGTGTKGAIREPYVTAIEAINASGARVLAIDLPSGMDCDTGQPLGPCVRAEHTATFVARKRGFDSPAAAEWTGTVHVIDIGVPRKLLYETLHKPV